MTYRTRMRLLAALLSALLALSSCALAEADVTAEQVETRVEEAEAFDLSGEPSDAEAKPAEAQEIDAGEPEPEAPEAAEPEAPEAAEPEVPEGTDKSDEADYTLSVTSSMTFPVCAGDTVDVTFTRAPLMSLESAKPGIASIDEMDLQAGTARISTSGTGKVKITAKTVGKKKVRLTLNVVARNKPTAVSFPEKTVSLEEGHSLTLAPVLTPATASTTFTWSSAKSKIAAVSPDGVVTAVSGAEGTAKITVKTQNGKKATVSVKVFNNHKPTGVALEPMRLGLGETRALTPVLTPSDASTTYTWKSSKKKVASVNAAGEVTAHKLGTAKITVTTANGKKATALVEVVADSGPDSVSILEGPQISLSLGDECTLTAVVSPESALTTYTWTSSDTGVARVIADSPAFPECTLIAVGGGATTITVTTANGKKAQVTVTVLDPYTPASIAIEEGDKMTVKVGRERTLTAAVTPGTAETGFAWSTSDESVAMVIPDPEEPSVCTMVAVGVGTAKVTVRTDNGLTAECLVTVTDGAAFRALLVANDDFYWGSSEGWEHSTVNKSAADKVKAMLNSVYSPTGQRYEVTLKTNLNKSGLISAIRETFRDADEDDVSLFYFASHGDSESTDERAGSLAMASLTAVKPEGMRLSQLAELLSAVPGKVIVALDTCGSGASVVSKGKGLDTSAIEASCAAFDAAVVQAFAAVDKGITVPADGAHAKTGELRVANKFYVLCSSNYLELSWAYTYSSKNISGSFFTDWFTEGIGRSGDMPADYKYAGNSDGIVDLYELYKYISAVGDDYGIRYDGSYWYQHVQVYPADTHFEMFK